VIDALREKNLWPSSSGDGFKKRRGDKTSGRGRNTATPTQKVSKKERLSVAPPSATPRNTSATLSGLTLVELAQAKKLPPDFLAGLGLADQKFKGASRVVIPYMDERGGVVAVRYRLSLNGVQRFIWRKGDRVLPYGLWKLKEVREEAWCLLEEGESDWWTCQYHGLPAIGIPGKSTFRPDWAELFQGLQVYLLQEPDALELPLKLVKFIPGLMVIRAPEGFKDLSQAHIQGEDIPALVERLKAQAIPAAALEKEAQDAQIKELRESAQPVLEAPDPLALVRQAIISQGYGGDVGQPIITYLAATSRLLAMRPGAMPVHLLLVAQASAGKSYLLGTILRLLPEEAYHVIDAGSPRVLIYDEADLQHRVLIFGETDSLPAGEDNPAASAVRTLLQEHCLKYKVTVKSPETGEYCVKEVEKPGPTVLITTSTRRLGYQLDTRVFSLDVVDTPDKIGAALLAQADLELNGATAPDDALIAYQSYLQALAPWEVAVPFIKALAT
jgi:hypothetical protein